MPKLRRHTKLFKQIQNIEPDRWSTSDIIQSCFHVGAVRKIWGWLLFIPFSLQLPRQKSRNKKNDAAPTEIKARLKQSSTLNAIDKVAVLFLPSRMNAKLQTVVAPRGSLKGARGPGHPKVQNNSFQ